MGLWPGPSYTAFLLALGNLTFYSVRDLHCLQNKAKWDYQLMTNYPFQRIVSENLLRSLKCKSHQSRIFFFFLPGVFVSTNKIWSIKWFLMSNVPHCQIFPWIDNNHLYIELLVSNLDLSVFNWNLAFSGCTNAQTSPRTEVPMFQALRT